jgi:ABC-type glutathione transport system ATPase component
MGARVNNILEIKNLKVSFDTWTGTRGRENRSDYPAETLCGIDLTMKAGEMLALVGESGSGKTVLCRTVFDLLGNDAAVTGGEIIAPPLREMSMV